MTQDTLKRLHNLDARNFILLRQDIFSSEVGEIYTGLFFNLSETTSKNFIPNTDFMKLNLTLNDRPDFRL